MTTQLKTSGPVEAIEAIEEYQSIVEQFDNEDTDQHLVEVELKAEGIVKLYDTIDHLLQQVFTLQQENIALKMQYGANR